MYHGNTTNNALKRPPLSRLGSGATAWLVVSVLVFIFDQATKYLAVHRLVYYHMHEVWKGFFSLTLSHNEGAAFSLGAGRPDLARVLFFVLAIWVSWCLARFLYKSPRKAHILHLGVAFIIGGALGNACDRLIHGYVIDFLHVHYYNAWHFPIFNVADIAICLGVFLFIWDTLFFEPKRK